MFEVSGNKPGANNALEVQVPCIVFFIITPIFVAIRIWSRVRTKVYLGYDDWTILISLTFSMTVSGLMMASCAYGFGQHITNLSHTNKLMTLKLFYVAQAFYKLTMNLTKASILLLYLRIFVQRYFRILCYILLTIISCYMVAAFMAAVFQCTPIPRAWNKAIPGICVSLSENWYANAGFSIATDFIILVLPMPILYKSNIPTNHKAALMFVFALGGFVMITSIFRMRTLDLSSTSPDTTFEITSSLWTIVEENVGIICACLPMCKWVLSILLPSIFPPMSRSNSYPSNIRTPHRTFAHAGTGKNDWVPSRGAGNDELAINLTNMKANGVNDNTSEEYILPNRQALGNEGRVIHRAVNYEVTYDETASRESMVGAIKKPH